MFQGLDQMSYMLPTAVILLMVSIGMSLKLRELASSLRGLRWWAWVRMVIATFLLPPLIALVLARVFRLTRGELAGMFMVGATPGAPLLTRNLARKGFDMHLAASYQIWAAMMVPVMIPIVVAAAGKVYNQEIWIPPVVLLKQIASKQLLPLGVGMVISWIAPKVGERYQVTLNLLGNFLLTMMVGLVLFRMGPTLKEVTPILPVVAFLLAAGSISAVWLMGLSDPLVKRTFAVCNANRHVGLALLLSGKYLHATQALPAIACYALIAPAVIFVYAMWYRSREELSRMGA